MKTVVCVPRTIVNPPEATHSLVPLLCESKANATADTVRSTREMLSTESKRKLDSYFDCIRLMRMCGMSLCDAVMFVDSVWFEAGMLQRNA